MAHSASVRTLRRRRLGGVAAVLVAVVLTAVVGAPAANATPWEDTRIEYSPCSAVWLWNSSGYGRIGMHYRHDTTYTKSTIEFTHITLDTYYCTPSEPRARAARLDLSETITLQGSNLSCSVGISLPPGFSYSCSSTGATVSFNINTSCPLTSSCEIATGPIYLYAQPGQTFRPNWALMQGFAHHVRSDGKLYAWSTRAF